MRMSNTAVRFFCVLLLAGAAAALSGYVVGASLSGIGRGPAKSLATLAALGMHPVRRDDAAYVEQGRRVYERHCVTCHGATQDDRVRRARSAFADHGDFQVFKRIVYSRFHGDMIWLAGDAPDSQWLAAVAYLRDLSQLPEPPPRATGPLPDGRYEYVAHWGGVTIYDIDRGFEPVRLIRIPQIRHHHGIEAHIGNGLLYVSFRRDQWGVPEQSADVGQLLAIDLETGIPRWTSEIEAGIDSFAVTPDGAKIYMPTGEEPVGRRQWVVLDARTGHERTRIGDYANPHNTIVSPDGAFAYLAATGHDHLGVVDASNDEIVGAVGPFGAGVRPFALTSDGRYALVNVNFLSGFEVADLKSRRVLHRVQVEGWPWVDPELPATQSHGIAFSPDEREAWVNDTWNRRVHIFDTSELPARPRYLGNVDVMPGHVLDADPLTTLPKWVRFTRDGRWVHVSNGAIIDARSRRIVSWVIPSRHYVEIHWRGGKPVASYPRYGNGYRSQSGSE